MRYVALAFLLASCLPVEAGVGVPNGGLNIHRQTGFIENEYRLHHHQQSLGIDDLSPTFLQSHASAIKAAAAQSQPAFDGACEAAVGVSWYRNRPGEWKAIQRAMWQALP